MAKLANAERFVRTTTLVNLPTFTLAGLMGLSLICAIVSETFFPDHRTFPDVWIGYSDQDGARLVAACMAGLFLALAVPLGTQRRVSSRLRIADLSHFGPMCLAVSSGCLILLLIAKQALLVEAPLYGAYAVPRPVVSLAQVGAPLGIVACGVSSRRFNKTAAVLTFLYSVTLLGYATRAFALIPLFFLAGRWLAGTRTRRTTWWISAALCMALLPLPLYLRGLPEHGLSSYAPALASSPVMAYEGGFSELVGNIGFTIAIAIHTRNRAHLIPNDALAASVNPLPAELVGWDHWEPLMRANYYVPYSSIGEWGSRGLTTLACAVFLWAVVTRLCLYQLARICGVSSGRSFLLIIGLALGLLGSVYIAQYNTRSVFRLLSLLVLLTASTFALQGKGYASLKQGRGDIG